VTSLETRALHIMWL